ncbi:MAG TPA: hypothetical protein VFD47_00785 [Actinomycetota bacterium]|nr:hypothetical protein [Actinomycetota bacterium]
MAAKLSGRITPRRVRFLERLMHLVTGTALVTYVYATPGPESAFTMGIRWLVPIVVFSGIAMWQGPRVRRYLRKRGARA